MKRTHPLVRLMAVSSTAILLWDAGARARAEPSASERETARNLMDEGVERRNAGDLLGARARFEAAHAIMNVPTTALELARAQAATQQLVEARASALAAANMPVDPKEPRVFTQARTDAASLALELAPQVPDVSLFVEPQPSNGRLMIDGIEMPRTLLRLPIKLNPGAHVLSLEVAGYAVHTQHFTLKEGEHAELRAKLTPVSAPQSAVVAARPETLAPSAPAVEFEPYPAARTRGVVAVTLGSTVLAGGIVAGILSATQTSQARDRCDGSRCPESARDKIDLANTLANIANVSIPVGVLGLGYGLFELLTNPYEEPPRSASSVQVSLDLARPGIQLGGAL